MAICRSCNKEMKSNVGCTLIRYEGETQDRIPFGEDNQFNCHDCGAPPGTLHHPGCDMEKCPGCGGQSIACECNNDEDDGDW